MVALKKFTEKEKAKAWLCLFLDSLRADLRINNKHELSDAIRQCLEKFMNYKAADLPIKQLLEYREASRKIFNKPDASIVELEMMQWRS